MHEQCATHKRALEAVIILPATTNFKDVGELLSSVHASEKATNRQCLYMIVACIYLLLITTSECSYIAYIYSYMCCALSNVFYFLNVSFHPKSNHSILNIQLPG